MTIYFWIWFIVNQLNSGNDYIVITVQHRYAYQLSECRELYVINLLRIILWFLNNVRFIVVHWTLTILSLSSNRNDSTSAWYRFFSFLLLSGKIVVAAMCHNAMRMICDKRTSIASLCKVSAFSLWLYVVN